MSFRDPEYYSKLMEEKTKLIEEKMPFMFVIERDGKERVLKSI